MTAKKQTAAVPVPPAPQPPAPAPVAVSAPTTPSKAEMTVMRLSVELAKRQVEVKPEMLSTDGKFLVLNIGPEWPRIVIGPGGGIDLPEIKSYPKAFEAAVEGDKLLAKQRERATKAATPAPAKTPEAPKPEEKKEASPAERKQAAHQAIEEKLDAQAEG